MKWTPGGSGEHVEDRRGTRAPGIGGLGRGGGAGIGAILIVLLLSWFTGRDLTPMLGLISGGESEPASVPTGVPPNDQAGQFATWVLNDNQEQWGKLLGPQYRPTNLVLFSGATNSGCGPAQASTGPFYCPADEKVYIDLDFYQELHTRFGASGDFAQAYVLAHEVGHHVQNVLGIEQEMRRAQRANPRAANELSVRMELEADCFAGIWGHSTAQRDILESGDVEEGLNAAAAIGDDRIQKQATGRISPESFTHGTSQQRATWLRRGLEQGSVEACDTFAAR